MSNQSIWVVLRRLTLPVYLPSVAGTLGIGMMVPVLPLYMRGIGLSFSDVGVVLGAAGVGAMLGAVPSGWVMARRDERVLLVLSLVVIAAATAVLGLTAAVAAMIALRVMFGAGGIGLRLALQTYVAAGVESGSRGRALSLIGGSFRLSLLIGPLLGGYLADAVGFKWTFMLCGSPWRATWHQARPGDRSCLDWPCCRTRAACWGPSSWGSQRTSPVWGPPPWCSRA